MTVRHPDFYVIGAPKCGTTSLFACLKQHPMAFLPDIKEPQYFCSDFPELMQVKTEASYLKLFKNAKVGQLIGEASVWYLFSKVAVANILRVNPQAKFIVMLRNPVDAVVSFHNHVVYSLVEPQNDFATAWNSRTLVKDATAEISEPASPFRAYEAIFSYQHQLERLYRQVPKSQVKVIFLEKFLQDPKHEFEQVLDFLELPPYRLDSYPVLNSARRWRYKFIERLLLKPPAFLKVAMKVTEVALNHVGIRPIKLLHKLFSAEGSASYVKRELKAELVKTFRPDVEQLRKSFPAELENLWDVGDTQVVHNVGKSDIQRETKGAAKARYDHRSGTKVALEFS